MKAHSNGTSVSNEESQVRSLYHSLIEAWNKNNAGEYADLFATNANVIGFDGSQMNGQEEIRGQLSAIFQNHKVATYVSVIREVRLIRPDVFVLRAVVGMISPGSADIMPERNAIQTLIAEKQQGIYKVSVFQNTPAVFDGRPQLREQLSAELRQALHSPK